MIGARTHDWNSTNFWYIRAGKNDRRQKQNSKKPKAMNMDETSTKTRLVDKKSNTNFRIVKVELKKTSESEFRRWRKKIKRGQQRCRKKRERWRRTRQCMTNTRRKSILFWARTIRIGSSGTLKMVMQLKTDHVSNVVQFIHRILQTVSLFQILLWPL